VTDELDRAQQLVDRGDLSRALSLLVGAERGAVAQGYSQLLPRISTLADEIHSRSDGKTRDKAERLMVRIEKDDRASFPTTVRVARPRQLADRPGQPPVIPAERPPRHVPTTAWLSLVGAVWVFFSPAVVFALAWSDETAGKVAFVIMLLVWGAALLLGLVGFVNSVWLRSVGGVVLSLTPLIAALFWVWAATASDDRVVYHSPEYVQSTQLEA
jgi:hypothetical protein